MKYFLTTVLIVAILNVANAQTEQIANKEVAASFEKNYNADNIDAIFSSMSKGMQSALPYEKTKEFLTNLKKQVGKITSGAWSPRLERNIGVSMIDRDFWKEGQEVEVIATE